MKSKNYIFTYLSALVIGILLLIFHDRESLYNSVVIAIGFLIAVPALVLMITEMARKLPSGADARKSDSIVKWTSVVASLAALAFGIWMICKPDFFVRAIIYTLGAILILVAIIQIVSIFQESRPFRPSGYWFVIPVLTLVAGVVIIVLGPAKISAAAGLITGIVLVVYAVNGFASTGREAKLVNDMNAMQLEKLREEARDEKAARKQAKADKKAEKKEAGEKKVEENKEEKSAAEAEDKDKK